MSLRLTFSTNVRSASSEPAHDATKANISSPPSGRDPSGNHADQILAQEVVGDLQICPFKDAPSRRFLSAAIQDGIWHEVPPPPRKAASPRRLLHFISRTW